MTQLTQKEVKFVWSDRCEESFQKLKGLLTSAPVLALPYGSGVMLYIVTLLELI